MLDRPATPAASRSPRVDAAIESGGCTRRGYEATTPSAGPARSIGDEHPEASLWGTHAAPAGRARYFFVAMLTIFDARTIVWAISRPPIARCTASDAKASASSSS
ncbi:hypothetical protein EV140_0168 [Microcella alkaliphila]|uniref:Uncharacterized protein n=1 Tax=Microcella alkaliphila TaxID=279828 RepID=A0A4Q7TV55_9MICO|nr:hypothetical protein EV140_0168 [Microcella alkaliphila]